VEVVSECGTVSAKSGNDDIEWLCSECGAYIEGNDTTITVACGRFGCFRVYDVVWKADGEEDYRCPKRNCFHDASNEDEVRR